MSANPDTEAYMIANDLDNISRRIADLHEHPRYQDALGHVQKAMIAMREGRTEIYQDNIKKLWHDTTPETVLLEDK